MKLTLVRYEWGPEGILGTLNGASGEALFDTLEHAYEDSRVAGIWKSKLPEGIYTCKKGEHMLSSRLKILTFEVTDVPGHKGILFHIGNSSKDSEGCILLGMGASLTDLPPHVPTLEHSRIAFSKFMSLLEGQDSFTLEVK